MHCSELLEKIEELRSEMYTLFSSDNVYNRLLDTSQQLDDLIVRYYRQVA
jgi:uncharacterized protein YdcH (DUF465 family)